MGARPQHNHKKELFSTLAEQRHFCGAYLFYVHFSYA